MNNIVVMDEYAWVPKMTYMVAFSTPMPDPNHYMGAPFSTPMPDPNHWYNQMSQPDWYGTPTELHYGDSDDDLLSILDKSNPNTM